jgi:hypothetical protein
MRCSENKNEKQKKIAILSITVAALVIMAILFIAYTPLVAEAQNTSHDSPRFSTSDINTLTDETLEDIVWEDFVIPWFMDGEVTHVVVPSRETDFFYGEKNFTIISINEFYEIYGANTTIPGLTFWMSESESGE